jgi:hypothetical protein
VYKAHIPEQQRLTSQNYLNKTLEAITHMTSHSFRLKHSYILVCSVVLSHWTSLLLPQQTHEKLCTYYVPSIVNNVFK